MAKPVLYAAKGSCSLCTQVALEEVEYEYDVVYVELFSGRGSLERVNPKGKVPALLQPDGSLLTQSAFLLPYIADMRPDLRLIGSPGTDLRGECIQWLGFFNSDVHPAFRALHRARLCRTDVSELAQFFKDAVAKHFDLVEKRYSESAWLTGDDFSVADIYAGACFSWARTSAGASDELYPAYSGAWKAFEARASVRRARHIEATTDNLL